MISIKNNFDKHFQLNTVLCSIADLLSGSDQNRFSSSFSHLVDKFLVDLDLYPQCIISKSDYIDYHSKLTNSSSEKIHEIEYENFLLYNDYFPLLCEHIEMYQNNSNSTDFSSNPAIENISDLISSKFCDNSSILAFKLLNSYSRGFFDNDLTLNSKLVSFLKSSFPDNFHLQIDSYCSGSYSNTDLKKILDTLDINKNNSYLFDNIDTTTSSNDSIDFSIINK
jgi:hypothetical protein